jgi:hypothetical protein
VAIPSAVMVFLVGQRITPFVSLWSTTTNKESNLEEGGRSVMRLQEICWKGREEVDLIRARGGNGRVGVCLALLAKRTTLNVFMNEMRKAWPPILSGNELAGFKIARVTGGEVVMGMSDDVAMKRTRIRDVNTVLVGEETTINLPVGETRAEGRGNSAIDGLEGIADEDIVTRGRGNEIT